MRLRPELIVLALLGSSAVASETFTGPARPVSVYITWAAHDELSDTVKLDQALAERQLAEAARLKSDGVQLDYFLLDMGWFDPAGGFRSFRTDRWPGGPDQFFAACARQGLKPGLWLSTNVCGWTDSPFLKPQPEWADSRGGYLNLAMSLYRGGFLAYQIETLQRWYDRGVRLFKFDFANLDAAPPADIARLGAAEMHRRNAEAWRGALEAFRRRNPDVMLIAYNGFGGQTGDTYPKFTRSVDPRWLDAYDSLYCGDPKPSDVPCASFWRSLDVYSDAMVFQYAANGIPLTRIDSSGFMIGNTGTIYRRGKAEWRGTLVLSGARGGRVNTYYGDLGLLDDADGRWFAKVQRLYFPIQTAGTVSTFGAYPGTGAPYGFLGQREGGSVVTVVNPGMRSAKVALPFAEEVQALVLFSDRPSARLSGRHVHLAPGQMAVVGTGRFASAEWDLGVQDAVPIPRLSAPLVLDGFVSNGMKARATFIAPATGNIRIVGSQTLPDGRPLRLSGGAPPSGRFVGELLRIQAWQDGKPLVVERSDDRRIWSGISWTMGEIAASELNAGHPVTIIYSVDDPKSEPASLKLAAYVVED